MAWLRGLGVAVALWLACLPAFAAEPLQPKQIEALIAAVPAIEAFEKEHAGQIEGALFNPFNVDAPFAALEAAGLYDEFETSVQGAGFSGGPELAEVFRRVLNAYLALNDDGSFWKELDAERAKIMADQTLDEEFRDLSLRTLDQTRAMFTPLETDLPVVRPYLDRLHPVLGGAG